MTSLVGAMTLVGGLLLALDRAPSANLGGLALPPLLATGSPRSIEAVFSAPKAGIEKGRWQAIVIHHSGSPVGTPASLESQALAQNLKGLGYQFVIGNGKGIGDGELHISRRWIDQTPGAHAGGENADWLNTYSIGICLIGNLNRDTISQAQWDRLMELVTSLSRELGIPAERVYLHSDVAPTTDPGSFFPTALFREELAARTSR